MVQVTKSPITDDNSHLPFQIFKETEWKKSISIPIVNDNQYENDMDFYVILKNPGGDAGLGDPSVCRITVIDDDGKFSVLSYNSTLKKFFFFLYLTSPVIISIPQVYILTIFQIL